MRSQRLASHSWRPPSTSKSTLLTAPEPISMPIVCDISYLHSARRSSRVRCSWAGLHRLAVLDDGAPREHRAAERARVDRIGIDVEREFAVVFAHEVVQRLDGRLVLGDAAGERELVADAARAREDRHRAQDDRAMQARHDVLALVTERQPVAPPGARE